MGGGGEVVGVLEVLGVLVVVLGRSVEGEEAPGLILFLRLGLISLLRGARTD